MTVQSLAEAIEVNPKTVERWITQGKVPYRRHQYATAAGPVRPGRLVAWTSLLVGLIALTIFGSVVAGAGEWVEGRELQTVAPWAIPALALTAVSSLVSSRAVIVGTGHRAAAVLAVTVALAVVAMVLMNPSIAPPVP